MRRKMAPWKSNGAVSGYLVFSELKWAIFFHIGADISVSFGKWHIRGK